MPGLLALMVSNTGINMHLQARLNSSFMTVSVRPWRDVLYTEPVFMSPSAKTQISKERYAGIYVTKVFKQINQNVPHNRLFMTRFACFRRESFCNLCADFTNYQSQELLREV